MRNDHSIGNPSRRRLLCLAVGANLVLPFGLAAAQKDWPALGPRINRLGLTRTLVLEGDFRGLVRGIQVGDFDGDSHPELAMLPQTGAYFFDAATLKAKSKLEPQEPDGKPRWSGLSPHLIANAGSFQVALLGGGFGDVGLLDNQFKPLWTFKPNPSLPPDAMVVDEARLGQPRFYVCDNGTLYRLDASGKTVWKVKADGARQLALVTDTNKQEAVVATGHGGSRTLGLWSASGKKVGSVMLPFAPTEFRYVRSGNHSGFVARKANRLAFVGRNGKQLLSHSYGDVPVSHGPSAVLLRLASDQPPVLAVRMESSTSTAQSVLSLFALDGRLLYEEFLKGGPALGMVEVAGEQRDRLLLGDGPNHLWAYELAPAKAASAKALAL